jgi:putative membrane protein
MSTPTWLKGRLRPEDTARIAEAIRQAESSTSGEIVPMIVRRSSTIWHLPVLLATLLVAVFFILGGPTRQVEARALLAFYQSNIQRTIGATGVLIFVSLMERRAVVLADKAIDELVPKDTWRALCDQLIAGIRAKGRPSSKPCSPAAPSWLPAFPSGPTTSTSWRTS